jgi:fused signal recognition particle receptor
MFNWFRRQFGSSEQPQEQQQASQTPTEAQPAETETVDEQQEEKTDAAQDEYLNWAKTAYQNIQKRKDKETEQLTEAGETLAQTSAETQPTQEIIEESTAVISEPIPAASEALKEEKATPEDTPETTEIQAETPVETDTPAWMRKSDRLEILKETAMPYRQGSANATPEPVEEPSTPPSNRKTTLKFDEEFVWSAKVLAAQGRNPEDISEEEINWLSRLRQGLGKTRRSLVNQLKSIVGQGPLNRDAVMEIEALLLQADVGIEATDYIISKLQSKLREEALPPEKAIAYLKGIVREILDRPLESFDNAVFVPEKDALNIWLLAGVNGAGKTTTIGKLAHLANKSGYSCIIAAADTFRAAAVEQVKVWGDRSGTTVIANPGKNTDPAAVVYDGIAAAQSRKTELLLVDTAGRLQNKKNLMDELSKIRRIIDKKAPDAKIESLLVLDATLGQNGLRQAQVFSEAAKLSGVVLTKLDGTAKGGVALAVAQQLNLPIRFVGAGEGIEDLRPFSSYEFVEALLNG